MNFNIPILIILLLVDIMVDNTVDYSANSFGKMNVHDKRYNLQDPFATQYNNDLVLMDTPAMNDADAEAIMNRMVYREASKPNNLLNDPILNRAFANDPTIAQLLVPKKDLLIEHGEPSKYENVQHTINRDLYEHFLDNPNAKSTEHLPSDKFWLEDPMVLFRNGNYYRIIPNESMSRIEVLNALTLFFLYLTILYILFAQTIEYIYIPLVAILMILFIYFIQKNDLPDQKRETFCRQGTCKPMGTCQLPTKGNPFMNVTMADLMDHRDRQPACMATDKLVDQKINQNVNYNLFKNVEDVFNRGLAQRQFYTMPSTEIPNRQTDFARWLYNLPPTCKENQANCLKYEDIRFNRFNPETDRMVRIKEDLV